MKIKFLCILIALCAFLSVTGSALTYPELTAKAALVMDPDSGEVLFEKNADQKMFPASTTKLMTALLAVELGNLDDQVTVSAEAVAGLYEQGSAVYFKPGEILTLRQLLDCMLVASCNDAANVIAEHIGGSIAAFVELMNKRAGELGCTGTHFANPHGLHDDNHYTTARDLYKIAVKAMEYPLVAELVHTKEYTLPPTNQNEKEQYFLTTNHLISRLKNQNYFYSKAIGIKTGFTTPAGYCLVAAATDEDRTYYAVIMGAEEIADSQGNKRLMNFVEAKQILEWAFDSYELRPILAETDPIQEIPVELAEDNDFVVLVPQYSVVRLVPADLKNDEITRTVTVEENVAAPVEKGQVLGRIVLSRDGKVYGEVPLVAASAVARSSVLYWLNQVGVFFSSIWFKVVLAVISALIVLFIVYVYIVRRGRRRRRGYTRKGRRR